MTSGKFCKDSLLSIHQRLPETGTFQRNGIPRTPNAIITVEFGRNNDEYGRRRSSYFYQKNGKYAICKENFVYLENFEAAMLLSIPHSTCPVI